jgi:hypothetical protein
MQLKTANELNMQDFIKLGLGNHYTTFDDDCGLCGEDVPGAVSSVPVAAVINGKIETNICGVYTDAAGVMRVANSDELVRCFA